MTYTARHRDDSNKARIDCDRRDLLNRWTFPFRRYQGHHHPFVAKVRAA
ncbi:MAG: hypothetical protein ACXVXN_00565 [Mycobacteriaceae bacterium]